MPKKPRQNKTAAVATNVPGENAGADDPAVGASAGSTIDIHTALPRGVGKVLELPRVEAPVEDGSDVDIEC